MCSFDQRILTLALVAVATLLIANVAAKPTAGTAGIGDSQDAAMGHAMNKLEMYVLQKRPKSGLTMDELRRAYAEFKSWSESARIHLPKKLPLVKLFVNFAMKPLENYPVQINAKAADWRFQTMYLDRLEKAYKKFRPAYLGQPCGDRAYNKTPKLDLALGAILGTLEDAPPVSRRMISEAKAEYESYMRRLEEIETADDIYGNQDEYMHSINLVNRGVVRALAKSVFPNMDLVESDLPKVRAALLDDMMKRNYELDNGKLVWYGPVDEVE